MKMTDLITVLSYFVFFTYIVQLPYLIKPCSTTCYLLYNFIPYPVISISVGDTIINTRLVPGKASYCTLLNSFSVTSLTIQHEACYCKKGPRIWLVRSLILAIF